MKTTLVTSLCALALALDRARANPTIPPDPAAPALATPSAATVPNPPRACRQLRPSPSATVSPKDADDLQSRIERKVKKGVHITFGDDEEDRAADARKRSATGSGTAGGIAITSG